MLTSIVEMSVAGRVYYTIGPSINGTTLFMCMSSPRMDVVYMLPGENGSVFLGMQCVWSSMWYGVSYV